MVIWSQRNHFEVDAQPMEKNSLKTPLYGSVSNSEDILVESYKGCPGPSTTQYFH